MLIFVGGLPPYLYPSGCLPRSRREDLSQPHNVHEGCTHHRGCVSSEDRSRSLSTLVHDDGYADTACVLAIAHMKAASSRATAAAMVFGCLPRASSLPYRPQRRTCARQAMSRMGAGRCC